MLQDDADIGSEDDTYYASEEWLNESLPEYLESLQEMADPAVHAASIDDGAGCRLMVDPYASIVVTPLAEGLDIELNQSVAKIEASATDGVTVTTRAGVEHSADCAVVTVPLGVLKNGHPDSSIEFEPALPPRKLDAIKRLGMGSHNKVPKQQHICDSLTSMITNSQLVCTQVILRWTPEDVFWPRSVPQLNCPDQRFQWLNLEAYGKSGCLLTHIFPPLAYDYDGLNDDAVVQEILKCLRGMFPSEAVKPPIDSCVTRWDTDPYSLGSYSFQASGSQKGDVEALGNPCSYQRIFWAGEAVAQEGRQCVHGASMTGVKAATDALGRPWRGSVFSTPNTFKKTKNAFDILGQGGSDDEES